MKVLTEGPAESCDPDPEVLREALSQPLPELRSGEVSEAQFDEALAELWAEQGEAIEEVLETVSDFRGGIGRESLVAYLYWSCNGVTRSEIRQVLDVFERVEQAEFTVQQVAELLGCFDSELDTELAVEVLGAIQEEARK
ncbi:hypothetical protein [Haloferax sp. Atlit-4N]|uniref:hypothetical protein n=1 Tax=Haloferax sp. Atlit-4N TaxID=2077206 RepID=UPI0011C02BF6|nr:hypothetical protein [Haloferax sp. Atlit-4N]